MMGYTFSGGTIYDLSKGVSYVLSGSVGDYYFLFSPSLNLMNEVIV